MLLLNCLSAGKCYTTHLRSKAWRDFFHYSNAHIENLPKHYSFFREMTWARIRQITVIGSMSEKNWLVH